MESHHRAFNWITYQLDQGKQIQADYFMAEVGDSVVLVASIFLVLTCATDSQSSYGRLSVLQIVH